MNCNMQYAKNKLMIGLLGSAVLLSTIIFTLTRTLDPFRHEGGMHGSGGFDGVSWIDWSQNVLFAIPFVLLAICLYVYRKDKEHEALPWINVVGLTFSSMSIISGAGGGVEFHFSIFMVIAAAAYYENVKLIGLMTILFAIQHLAGFFFVPELVFGSSTYPFIMLVLHAGFLILTSSATILQILSKARITKQLTAEKEQKEERMLELLAQVHSLSERINSTSTVVSSQSEANLQANSEMRIAFQEVTSGLADQSESIDHIDQSVNNINHSITEALSSSDMMKQNAIQTEQDVEISHQNIGLLIEYMNGLSQSVGSVADTMQVLKHSTSKAQDMVSVIRHVAEQTHLLALNASIEAARAGEHGSGFAVVATEIRKLAAQSRSAAEEIESIMTVLRQDSEQTEQQISSGQSVVDASVRHAEQFAANFAQVKITIQQLLDFIKLLNQMLVKIQHDSGSVTGEIAQISAVIEQGMASMQQLTAMSDSQLASAKQIDEQVSNLRQLSTSMQQQFTE